MTPADADQARRRGLVSAGFLERLAGSLGQRDYMSPTEHRPDGGEELRWEVGHLDLALAPGVQQRVAAHRFQLADVAAPRSGHQTGADLGGERGQLLYSMELRLAPEKLLCQGQDLVPPLGQGRHADHKVTEAVSQVAPELALRNQVVQLHVGGGDETDVDLPVPDFTEASDLAVEYLEQDLLHLGRGEAELVEEEGAMVGRFDKAHAVGVGAGKGAAGVPAQMCHFQVLGDGGGRLSNKSAGAAGQRVDVAGQYGLTRAALAEEEDGVASAGIPQALLQHLRDSGGDTEQQPWLLGHTFLIE